MIMIVIIIMLRLVKGVFSKRGNTRQTQKTKTSEIIEDAVPEKTAKKLPNKMCFCPTQVADAGRRHPGAGAGSR